jgi:hypothetical protein
VLSADSEDRMKLRLLLITQHSALITQHFLFGFICTEPEEMPARLFYRC